jgi:lipopolysaccharide/colanic/teichoic acid biosynthesis glycosyltransferase
MQLSGRIGSVVLGVLYGLVVAPILAVLALLVLVDVGFPVLVWTMRFDVPGRPVRLYRFRTLSDPFDDRGRRLTLSQRSSRFGRFLREFGLDQAPQWLGRRDFTKGLAIRSQRRTIDPMRAVLND